MDEEAGWRLRTPILAALGFIAGLAVWLLIADAADATPIRVAAASFVVVGAMVFGFVVERARIVASLVFALICGIVAAAILYWNGPTNSWSASEGWRLVSLGLAIGIAAPLFQAWDGMRPVRIAPLRLAPLRLDYVAVHDHAWTNAVLFAASWAFVAIVLLLTLLLSGLFGLIGIDVIEELMRTDWFPRLLVGTAFGTGLGLLRDQGRVVGLLQRVVMIVLGVLAPILAAGLAIFLIALPFTGFDALWDGWASAAALMLGCVIAAVILANAVIGNHEKDAATNPALRWAALVLAIVMLPLAVLASVAIGLRIGQYGFTPDRLWALTFAVIASGYGVAYFGSVVLGRTRWAQRVRPANLRLAIATCVLALVLATPLPSFNALSTRDQVARLESGRVAPEQFDWGALAFDFGEPGRAATRRLAASDDTGTRSLAGQALKADNRYALSSPNPGADPKRIEEIRRNLRVIPEDPALRARANAALQRLAFCAHACVAVPTANGGFLIAHADARGAVSTVEFGAGGDMAVVRSPDTAKLHPGSTIDVRPVARRQLHIDGKPAGEPFE